jgi:hypothetical protein
VSLTMARFWLQPSRLARKKIRLLPDVKTPHVAGVFVKLMVYTVCIELSETGAWIKEEVISIGLPMKHTIAYEESPPR